MTIPPPYEPPASPSDPKPTDEGGQQPPPRPPQAPQPPQYAAPQTPQYGAPGLPPQPPQYGGPQGYGQPSGPLGASDPDDLTLPLYGATIQQAVTRWLKNYVNFSGRASRSEFWWVALVSTVIPIVLSLLGMIGSHTEVTTVRIGDQLVSTQQTVPGPFGIAVNVILVLYSLAVLLPSLGLIWRRFHDTDRSGGFYFLALIPFVGGIIVIVLLALDSKPEGARFDRR
ncbi:DUF805 domain-containing protein [Pseudoclavibacter sp. 13-3]|uniref:DUF805 domain-containing protein n=1 Tax=Pseudoclavibacter sp. 13-3 TaxID=2901228 RepID=UPI001E5D57E7|nr:DUF805 domain-containing protein [Pseudoclavibacter sp. 13-3]MCD7101745.1 DUF805 domain-containing protein [Pseudoclavibacter sp. 13-3]